MKQAFYVFAVTVMTLLSSGCSSSDDGDSGGGDTTPTLPPTSAVLGSATAQNGLIAAQALFNVQGFVEVSAAQSAPIKVAMSPMQTPVPPDTVWDCVNGGTAVVSGDFSETSFDTLWTYTDCQLELDGPIIQSGTIRKIAYFQDASWELPTYLKDIYMTDVFIQMGTENSKVFAGSFVELRDILYSDIDISSATVELSMQTETAGEIERLEKLVMKLALSSSGDSLCYAAGDVYVDNNLTYYLQISTGYDPLCNDAFTLDSLQTTLVSGSMELVGSDGNVSMHVTSENNITIEGIDGSMIFSVQ